jgi:hypothetical protein
VYFNQNYSTREGEVLIVSIAISTAALRMGVRPEPERFSLTTTATGPTVAIAAPGAGKRIVLTAIQEQNLSAVATSITVLDGAIDITGVLGQNQGDGAGYSLGDGWPLQKNAPLSVALSAGNSCNVRGMYYIEVTG